MTPLEARQLVGQVPFLDVREQFEWDAGHIEDSVHIPMGELPTRVDELDVQSPVVVVCHVGQRSALVAEWLNERGLEAHNLDGGLAAWAAAGFPLVGGDG